MKISVSSAFREAQSLSLPGRTLRVLVSLFRETAAEAARDASRARAASTTRFAMRSAAVGDWFSQRSSSIRTAVSTGARTSGLLSRSFVCPWNCGFSRNTLRIASTPSRMSSAAIVTPRGISEWVSR